MAARMTRFSSPRSELRARTGDRDAGTAFAEHKSIGQIDRLKNGFDVVVAVAAFVQHVEVEIEFRVSTIGQSYRHFASLQVLGSENANDEGKPQNTGDEIPRQAKSPGANIGGHEGTRSDNDTAGDNAEGNTVAGTVEDPRQALKSFVVQLGS